MAVTKIWKITNNLGKVINYSENGKKTKRNSLDDTLDYAMNRDKTEKQFYIDELLRIAKPYLTRKEFNVLKKAVANVENFDDFKRDLFKNKNYEYKILSRVLKKIGGLFNE